LPSESEGSLAVPIEYIPSILGGLVPIGAVAGIVALSQGAPLFLKRAFEEDSALGPEGPDSLRD